MTMCSETTIHNVEKIKISTLANGLMLTCEDTEGNQHEITLYHKDGKTLEFTFR